MEPKKILWSVFGIAAFVFIMIFFVWYINSRKIMDKPGFSQAMLVLIFLVFVFVLIMFLIWFFATKETDDKGMHVLYKNINTQLMMMDNGTEFSWKRGFGIRVDRRKFDDGKEYIAVIGNTVSGMRQHVIYNIDDKYIAKFTGDPEPDVEIDMFKGFKPQHKDKFMAWDQYNKMIDAKSKMKQPNVVVNNTDKPGSEQQIVEGKPNEKKN